jgi:hypothetical protein
MTGRWWLSFADPDRPAGEQSLGVCIVQAVDVVSAVKVSHALKINPGGQVLAMSVDEQVATRLSFNLGEYQGRLIPPAEARELADQIATEIAS